MNERNFYGVIKPIFSFIVDIDVKDELDILNFLWIVEFQWFFIALSVRPGTHLAIKAHLLPNLILIKKYLKCAYIIAWSYYSVHLSFFISGLRWLCHLYRHCFPILPGRFCAIRLQFLAPFWPTNEKTKSSSYFVLNNQIFTQGPLISLGFKTFCHLWRHWTSVLV